MPDEKEKEIAGKNEEEVLAAPVEPVEMEKIPEKKEKDFKKNIRRPSRREARIRAKPEFDNKLLEIRRVARVVSGGRRFSFSASIVVGDRKGRVGVGVGKSADTPVAIEKALRNGKKNMVTIVFTKQGSIPHAVEAKYG